MTNIAGRSILLRGVIDNQSFPENEKDMKTEKKHGLGLCVCRGCKSAGGFMHGGALHCLVFGCFEDFIVEHKTSQFCEH